MKPEVPSQTDEERELLQREVDSLAAQVKLLVKAEHAVTRSRRELDRQLQRIRRLAEFSLHITGVQDAGEVLEQARRAMLDFFELDEVVALHFDGVEHTLPLDLGIDAPDLAEPSAPRAARLLEAAAAQGARAAYAKPSPESLPPNSLPRLLLWVPLRARRGEIVAILVGWTARVTAHHRDLPRAEHLPFLALFGDHVTRALANAQLTAELLLSNQQLQKSVLELERTQAQLVQAQKLEALGRLSGGIAHDFNNLLTLIVSHAELIRPVIADREEASDDLAMIFDATKRASAITRRLLAFGRQQGHKQELVDLNALSVDLSRMLRRLIGDDVTLQLELDTNIGRVHADPVQLEQILMNLVVNARDAMPQGGTLTIETRNARQAELAANATSTVDMIALIVSDTGTGIDDATKKQLFEPFFTTKPIGKGTGLGLATVYGLVSQNRGHVSVTSAPGQGATFTVLLPTAEGPGEAAIVPSSAARGSVMVVEDEAGIRRMIARVLRRSGFEVYEARDGREGLEVAQRLSKLDLVVTDVVMPIMSGPELARGLRSIRPSLPVLFMSGHTFDCLDWQALNPDLDCFLPKPFSPEKLVELVSATLERRAPGAPLVTRARLASTAPPPSSLDQSGVGLARP